MIKQHVEFFDGGMIIKDSFSENTIAVRIPDDNPLKNKLMDLLLYLTDEEMALNYLRCISDDKPNIVNKALFLTGLNYGIRCLKTSNARRSVIKLDKEEFVLQHPEYENLLNEAEALRDKYFMHDDNGMTQTTTCLFVRPGKNGSAIVDNASAYYNEVCMDYYSCSYKYQGLFYDLYCYFEEQFDECSRDIVNEYDGKSFETLQSFGDPHIVLASMDTIDQSRKYNC